ncbi:MAG: hypothetical protein A2654_01865 [Candidatus Nealsonbacteria bacterium RIFCSPHIGHO2_01_FULL_43_31]|uniref:PsbP C-terminal domain-containing protein n=2 Tax=Candidatus Nealsoniibacteriota TaxID=1817911 RepID=A0A1G2EAN1_9BACT|nr:MAG: hypothetical protein A2654_01865 [Candidatus Nealsonbacteria bacterium RIFCSPHIGHO2_01_FULL_43_31]OGZ22351.1 MAG: hypothetical protein A3D46_00585 [Candidatus Nealsonbacteria bacterium RIFCSPHIGHO2_02_FULL_43_13]
MKIKIFIVAITVTVLFVLSAAGVLLYQNLNKSEIKKELPVIGESPTDREEILKETRLLKDEFEITLPPGWQEATSANANFLLLAFDAQEDISGGNFQKLDFRTNLSIKSDDLSRYSSLDTLEKYVESMKVSLIQSVPGINFIREEQKIINGVQAIFIECSSRQEEADFKTLLVFVQGGNDIIYAISFNTFQSSWADYQDVFEQISRSFKLRYDI